MVFLCLVGIVFLVGLAMAWRLTDWDVIEKRNKGFYDENGDHAYYDHFKHRKR